MLIPAQVSRLPSVLVYRLCADIDPEHERTILWFHGRPPPRNLFPPAVHSFSLCFFARGNYVGTARAVATVPPNKPAGEFLQVESGSSHNCRYTSTFSLQCGLLSSRTPAVVSWVSRKMRKMTRSIVAIPPPGTVLGTCIFWNISRRRSCHIELLVVSYIHKIHQFDSLAASPLHALECARGLPRRVDSFTWLIHRLFAGTVVAVGLEDGLVRPGGCHIEHPARVREALHGSRDEFLVRGFVVQVWEDVETEGDEAENKHEGCSTLPDGPPWRSRVSETYMRWWMRPRRDVVSVVRSWSLPVTDSILGERLEMRGDAKRPNKQEG